MAQTGVRFPSNPSPAIRLMLAQWMGCQRSIYSAKAHEDRYFRTFQRKTLALTGQYPPHDQQYSQFKNRDLTPWLYDVPSEILRNGAVRYQQAYSRFQQGLAGRPRPKKKSNRQSVWLTSELFRFEPLPAGGYKIILGCRKTVWGELPFTAHLPYQIPNSLVVSRQGGKWFVSFSYDDGTPEPEEADILAHYSAMSKDDLASVAKGYDRGVAIPFMSSENEPYDFSPAQKKHLDRLEKYTKKYQKRAARCKKGSRRCKKAYARVARCYGIATNIRRDFAHQTSYALAHSSTEVFVGEALKIGNMVKAPAPKPLLDATGQPCRDQHGKIRYQKNGRKAKSGLAKSILSSVWGQTWMRLQYKARRKGKLTIKVPPHYSSQECAECGHIDSDNRLIQSEFRCTNCGHVDNADHNASRVVKKRGIQMLLAGEIKAPKRKKTIRMAKKQKVGPEGSKPADENSPKLDSAWPGPSATSTEETPIRRRAGATQPAHRSVKRETPATRPQGL